MAENPISVPYRYPMELGAGRSTDPAVRALVEAARQFTADEWEHAIGTVTPNSVLDEATRAMRWVRLCLTENDGSVSTTDDEQVDS